MSGKVYLDCSRLFTGIVPWTAVNCSTTKYTTPSVTSLLLQLMRQFLNKTTVVRPTGTVNVEPVVLRLKTSRGGISNL